MCGSAFAAGNAEEWGAARAAARAGAEPRASLDTAAPSSAASSGDGSGGEAGPTVLYDKGTPSDCFTLILQGKVLIRTGAADSTGWWKCCQPLLGSGDQLAAGQLAHLEYAHRSLLL
jgi:hypothetical protein